MVGKVVDSREGERAAAEGAGVLFVEMGEGNGKGDSKGGPSMSLEDLVRGVRDTQISGSSVPVAAYSAASCSRASTVVACRWPKRRCTWYWKTRRLAVSAVSSFRSTCVLCATTSAAAGIRRQAWGLRMAAGSSGRLSSRHR